MMATKLYSTITTLAIGVLLIVSNSVKASPYVFSVDSFQSTGNLPGSIVDEFNGGVLGPQWTTFTPTVDESGGVVTLSNPGSTGVFQKDNFLVSYEMTNFMSESLLQDGSGDFQGSSSWLPIVPGLDQSYRMSAVYLLPSGQAETIGLWVGSSGTNGAAFVGLPGKVDYGIAFGSAVGPAGGFPTDFNLQFFPIDVTDVTGDIVLKLSFNDNADLFTGSFSLDGGATFQNPFSSVASRMNGHHSVWDLGAQAMEVQVIPEPSTLLIMSTGLAGLAVLGRRRLN